MIATEQRVAEAVALLGEINGVSGLILGGNAGPGEWPLSDVDIIVVYEDAVRAEAAAQIERRRGQIEDFWGWCGVSGSFDLGTSWVTESEARQVVAAGAAGLAGKVGEPRWFHAMDCAFRGRILLGLEPVVADLLALITAARFSYPVVDARVRRWAEIAAEALAAGHTVVAAEALIDWCSERWGSRAGSLGRRWTRFETFAALENRADVAARILACRGARVEDVAHLHEIAPWWLRHRIDGALAARLEAHEKVTPAQNARDQVVAFADLWRRRSLPGQPWTEPAPPGVPDPAATLGHLLRDGR